MTQPKLRMGDPVYSGLSEIVGTASVFIDGNFYDECSSDATEMKSMPSAVVAVSATEQIPRLLRLARNHRIPVIARGAGTGYTGGAIAESGGIVLALNHLNKIIEIRSNEKLAIAEPGVITQDLADAAEAAGLFYPPDPASVKESSIGGNVAECAGGLRCKKYGLTKDYVIGLEGFDIDGEFIQTGYFAEEETYDLGSVLTGSEGTLAVITRIALQLIEPPKTRNTFFATFTEQGNAAEVVANIMAAGIVPSVLEFMDGDAIACTMAYLNWADSIPAEAALLIEVDGEPDEVSRESSLIKPIVLDRHPIQFEVTQDKDRRDYLWTLRRSISRAVTAAAKIRVSEDVCVPPSKFPALVQSLPSLGAKYQLRVNSFGHAGDGNLHVNFLANHDTEVIQSRIHDAVVDLFKITLSLDGTISGEHGIGITKRDYLPLEVAPNTMVLFHKVKSAFDPPNLVNPGKIFQRLEK